DVLEEDKAQHDVLVLGGVHVGTQLVCGSPQGLLQAFFSPSMPVACGASLACLALPLAFALRGATTAASPSNTRHTAPPRPRPLRRTPCPSRPSRAAVNTSSVRSLNWALRVSIKAWLPILLPSSGTAASSAWL